MDVSLDPNGRTASQRSHRRAYTGIGQDGGMDAAGDLAQVLDDLDDLCDQCVELSANRLTADCVLGLTLVAICAGSLILFARTNRQFTWALLSRPLWSWWWAGRVVATRLAAGDIEQGRTEGAAMFQQLAQARILAEKARTDETLELIAHGDITESEKSFSSHIEDLSSRLGAGPAAAAEGVRNWSASHRKAMVA